MHSHLPYAILIQHSKITGVHFVVEQHLVLAYVELI